MTQPDLDISSENIGPWQQGDSAGVTCLGWVPQILGWEFFRGDRREQTF
ncbi:hypothetical protein [Oscillatoria acuminata]|nr:hypothetical protein [Oscillatoria acuminata]